MPQLGVGTSTLKETAAECVKHAIGLGYRLADAAQGYDNEAEVWYGIKESGIGRSEVFIISKVSPDAVRSGKVRESLDRTIEAFGGTYVDLMLIHWPDVNTDFAETADALNALKKSGKVLHIGVSNFTREQMEEIGQYCTLEAYQPQYSMVVRTNEEQMKWAAEQGMGVMTYGSLGGGILTGAFRKLTTFEATDSRNRFYKHFQEPMFSKVMKVLEVMDRISADRDNVPLSQIALNWCAQKEFVSSCIVGAQSRRKIEENCAAYQWMLTSEEIALLDAAIEQYLVEQ